MLRPGELEIAKNAPPAGCSPEAAQQFTKWLATHHYENFNVVSWLLPKELHQHFYNVYAYCRWADDLGDEIPDPQRALELLDWWEAELNACYQGQPSHPVFVALRETIVAKEIPKQPFADLLKAFRQDQTVKRYPTWDSVLKYCVYSANPVGRLVLYLCGYRDERRQLLSDSTCTALQLANFWQDVSRDLEKGRIYIPLDAAAAHGLAEADIVNHRFDDRYVNLMKDLIARTRALFAEGAPLAKMVDSRLSIDLDMFSRGGLAVLDAIEASGYDTVNASNRANNSAPVGGALVLPALVDTMRRYNMPARYLHDLISGAEMDLTVRTYPTFDRLREYCYRVAGTVGLTCTHVFGFIDPRALDLAEKLGLAFQLTNIIRDVGDDYALGRVYLPEEDLERYNVSPQDFGNNEATLGVRELLRFEADRAWQCYDEGAALLNLVEPEGRGTLWLLAHTYSALLARIESLDFAVFGERVRLSRAEKMLFIAQARFGRVTEENILEKCDRSRRRPGGLGSRRRAG